MSDAVGPVHVETRGGGGGGEWRVAAQTEALVDSEVKRLLGESYERVTRLLRAATPDLHTLAAALLEKETLTATEARTGYPATHSLIQPHPTPLLNPAVHCSACGQRLERRGVPVESLRILAPMDLRREIALEHAQQWGLSELAERALSPRRAALRRRCGAFWTGAAGERPRRPLGRLAMRRMRLAQTRVRLARAARHLNRLIA